MKGFIIGLRTILFNNGVDIFEGTAIPVSNGNCTLDSGQLPSKKGKGTDFMVGNVTHGTLGYDGSANHDPDGDSNGTAIQLSK